jgi:inner membrane protein
MDNVTHSLTGLALARVGLSRFCPRATLLLILSANAPDADIVAAVNGPLQYFEAHRGYTHSLIGLPVLAIIPVLVTAAIFRQKLPWLRAWILCCIGIASHLLLDWTNSYGVRLLLPFSSKWVHLDLNGLYDLYILAALAFAAVWPFFAQLVSREIGERAGSGRGTAIFALSFFLLFDLGRLTLHSRAVAQLASRLYDNVLPLQVAALPDAFDPFKWTGVIETAARYELIPVNTLGQFNPEEGRAFFKPALTPTLESAKRTAAFRYFAYFARFPVWSESPVVMDPAPGTRVQLTDLRFGTPGAGSFHCIALENHQNQVLQSWFTFGSGAELGWGMRGAPATLVY